MTTYSIREFEAEASAILRELEDGDEVIQEVLIWEQPYRTACSVRLELPACVSVRYGKCRLG